MGRALDTSLPETRQPEGVGSGEAWCGGEGLSRLGMVGVGMIPLWANPSQEGRHPPSTDTSFGKVAVLSQGGRWCQWWQ